MIFFIKEVLIGGNLPFSVERSVVFGKVKDTFHKNTEIKRLPEEKIDIKVITAVNNLIKVREGRKKGTVMDIQQMQGYGGNVQPSSLPVRSKSVELAQRASKTVQDELSEIIEILQEAILLAQEQNNSLGDLKAPEFNDLQNINMITAGMVRNFSSLKIGQLISEMAKTEAKIQSIMLYCKEKNLQTSALQIIQSYTRKIVYLKGREEFNALAGEGANHEKKVRNILFPKKSYSR